MEVTFPTSGAFDISRINEQVAYLASLDYNGDW
jgi:hypothetical protein